MRMDKQVLFVCKKSPQTKMSADDGRVNNLSILLATVSATDHDGDDCE